MYSEKNSNAQNTAKRSFIELARRAQIVEAAIETLADVGFGNTSLARVAKRIQISPSLISYHFTDKDALILQVLEDIATSWDTYVEEQVSQGTTASEQLRRYIVASLLYMGTRPAHFAALIEIVFNARTKDGTLLYRVEEEEPGFALLKSVLAHGQQTGEFREFNIHHVAVAIRGAISEFFGEMHRPDADLESYTAELVDLFARVTASNPS